MGKFIPGTNDLKTLFPEIAKEANGWDPSNIAAGSQKRLSWICSLGHTWEARPGSRTYYNSKCPYCSNKLILKGFNDLQTTHPEVARRAHNWDPTSIGGGSTEKKEWRCDKGEDHSYLAPVNTQTKEKPTGCPYCSGQKVLDGFNDLATNFPEIAAEAYGWEPSEYLKTSRSKVLWKGQCGHTWEAVIRQRTTHGTNCPICANLKVLIGFNDLSTTHPMIAKEAHGWDPTTVVAGNQKKFQWKASCGHSWEASLLSRTSLGRGCPFCAGKIVIPGENDLQTKFPDIAKEANGWNPAEVMPGNMKLRSWKCSECSTEWNATACNRTANNSGCPACAEYGYSFAEPGYMYLMERPGEQQFGITNSPKRRMYFHRKNGWKKVELIGPFNGQKVFELELEIKRWLKSEIGTMKNTTENWSTESLEVKRLSELAEKADKKILFELLSSA